jgi:hypothetical protein
MDDGLRQAALMLSQQFVVNPQTCRVVIAGVGDAELGLRAALLNFSASTEQRVSC